MSTKEIKPYGTWPSPLSAAAVAGASRRFGDVRAAGRHVYWSEGRPDEGGRQVLMRWSRADGIEELLAAPFSARSKVHEYGGGEFAVSGEDVFFVNADDQDIYHLRPGANPRRITTLSALRFADIIHDAGRQRLVAVAERHHRDSEAHAYPDNLLVAVSLDPSRLGDVTVLAEGRSFYAAPRLAPDGGRLAYLAWDLPDMPWDGAELWLADLDTVGQIAEARCIVGGDGTAAFQPEWQLDGKLYFVWDAGGWSNLYWLGASGPERATLPKAAELARPMWVFGVRSYAFVSPQVAVCAYVEGGAITLERIDLARATSQPIDANLLDLDRLTICDGALFAIAARGDAPSAISEIGESGVVTPIRSASEGFQLSAAAISRPESLVMRDEAGNAVYATYYPPRSAMFEGPAGTRPPAIVTIHGGPTASGDRGLSLRTQFWTSRGFAVVDLDYAGSTGYGRDYRQRLDGQWGIADVADAATTARHLAAHGLADPGGIVISGGSAGGYTVLMALATTNDFAAGSSRYGIADLALLQDHTHKFEGGYLYRLLGTSPETAAEVFRSRSPLTHAAGMAHPVILFQGLDDKVVPPEQSRLIAGALHKRGIEVELHEFAGEGHGFRKAETIIAVLQAELAFFQRTLGIDREYA